MDLNAYLNKEIRCSCGHTHYASAKAVFIEKDALKRIPGFIQEAGYTHVLLAADPNTWKAAGEKTAELLRQANIQYSCVIFEENEPIPNETAIGRLFTAMPADTDLILGVGSGVINDLCKYVSYRTGIECMLTATAPSMDGFVSVGAALILNHVKVTVDTHSPEAVFADTDILKEAPMKLIAAGLGDTLGKYTCLLDWKLSRIINDEYYCEEIAQMAETSLKTVRELAISGKVEERDPEAIASLTEALVMTGIAMAYAGNSRPASGCEHHMSHFWEMKALMNHLYPDLHGAQVGVGLVFAPGILTLEAKAGKNDLQKRNHRLDVIREHWAEIRELIETELPKTEEMVSVLRSLQAPVTLGELGFPAEWVKETILCAKEVRDRYTMLQLLWDLGLSERYADMADAFEKELSEGHEHA